MALTREERERFVELLMPFAMSKQREIKDSGRRFAYYTSAEVALRIIRTKQVWMRHVGCMNDFREIDFGIERLDNALRSKRGQRFLTALDAVYSGTSDYVVHALQASVHHFLFYTYIVCFSEHLESEDKHGRLSMWRAYGGETSVAIVMNSSAFFNESTALRIYSSPVAYWEQDRFEQEMETVAQNIEANLDLIRSLGEDHFRQIVFNVCKFAVLCSKHPGFEEEREWRVVYSPTFETSPVLVEDTVSIGGVPQRIYKIPLQDIPEEGLIGIELPQLIERIIVGPTKFPAVIADALEAELRSAGISDAESRIVISDIPLRR